jgi:hypothetical protein
MIFAYSDLRAYLQRLMAVAPIRSLAGWDKRERAVLLRHDIDLDVEAAYRMCSLEAELGACASVLFLTTCDTYNVRSQHSRARIRALSDLGFDVGLHFDPTVYGADEPLAPRVDEEAALLADVTGRPVRTISLHNPSLHGQYPVFEGYLNAYEPPYFDPNFYLSDSCMDFRGKHPDDVIDWLAHDRVQLLLHPLHFGEETREYASIVRQYLGDVEERIDTALAAQNKTYRAQREARHTA